MEGDEVLHNGLHSSACSLDPDNEVSTLTDTIDVLITTGNIHATPRSPPTCHEILIQYGFVIFKWVLTRLEGNAGFQGCKSLGQIAVLRGDLLGPFIFHWGTSIVIPILIGGILIIARAVTLVLQFLNPLLYHNIPLLAVFILEQVAGRY